MTESPHATSPSTLSVAIDLVVGEMTPTRVSGELRYDARDPYAVTLRVLAPSGSIDWLFARDLLSRGLYGPAGHGDVRTWPCLNPEANAIVVVELHTPTGNGLLQLPSRTVRAFLTASHQLVHPGTEGSHLDLDVILEGLLERRVD